VTLLVCALVVTLALLLAARSLRGAGEVATRARMPRRPERIVTPQPILATEGATPLETVVTAELHCLIQEDGQTRASSLKDLPPDLRSRVLESLRSGSPDAAVAHVIVDAEGKVLDLASPVARSPEVRAALERAYAALGSTLQKSPDERD
jgi:cytochrome c-type biogenesis protein CcmH/NrfF